MDWKLILIGWILGVLTIPALRFILDNCCNGDADLGSINIDSKERKEMWKTQTNQW